MQHVALGEIVGRPDRIGDPARHLLEGGLHQVVLRLEVRVEAAVGQPGSLHNLRDSDAVDALLPKRVGSRLHDSLAGFLFMFF